MGEDTKWCRVETRFEIEENRLVESAAHTTLRSKAEYIRHATLEQLKRDQSSLDGTTLKHIQRIIFRGEVAALAQLTADLLELQADYLAAATTNNPHLMEITQRRAKVMLEDAALLGHQQAQLRFILAHGIEWS
jgi:hypothetical protein